MKATDLQLVPYPDLNVIAYHAVPQSLPLRPIDVYCVLKRLYGEPNETADNYKSQFEYCFRANDCYVFVYDWKLTRCSIAAMHDHGDVKAANRVVDEVAALILANLEKARSDIRKAAKLDGQTIYENPFATYYRAASRLMKLSDMDDEAEIDSYIAAFFLFQSAFEGLVNLLYEVYLRPEFREDRFISRFAREQLDLKIRLAPIYCSCFKPHPISARDPAFAEWHRMVNLRNDFIHANLVEGLRHKLISFEGRQFFVYAGREIPTELPRSAAELWPDDIERMKRSIDGIVALLRNHLKRGYGAGFRRLVRDSYISVEVSKTGRPTVSGGDDIW